MMIYDIAADGLCLMPMRASHDTALIMPATVSLRLCCQADVSAQAATTLPLPSSITSTTPLRRDKWGQEGRVYERPASATREAPKEG